MTETQKHIYVKNYQDIIIKEFASATKRKQKVYYQMALDEFISNHSQEIREQGIDSHFLIQKSKRQPDLLEEMPLELKEVYGLKKEAPASS